MNRNIRPCTAASSTPSMGEVRLNRASSSRLQSSANSALRVPKDSMREVNTPGSDSMVHQSSLDIIAAAVGGGGMVVLIGFEGSERVSYYVGWARSGRLSKRGVPISTM